MQDPSREPGWYPDRNDPEFNRYWNGRAWTARRQPVNTPATAPPPRRRRAMGGLRKAHAPSATSTPKARIPIWLWIVGGLMVARSVLGVVAAFDGGTSGTHTAGPSANPSPVSAPATPH